MRRIGLAVVLAVSLLAPLAATAQQAAKIPRLGYLVLAPLSETPSPEGTAFLAGLRELGWIEGKTIAVEYHFAKRLRRPPSPTSAPAMPAAPSLARSAP
jgi:putative tryptophan/tyrosine transport system substrate-binding protein